jgi:hypothetical protein
MPTILKFPGYRINTLSLLLKLPGYTITHNSGLLLKPPGYWIHRINHFFTLGIQAQKRRHQFYRIQWNSEGIKKHVK